MNFRCGLVMPFFICQTMVLTTPAAILNAITSELAPKAASFTVPTRVGACTCSNSRQTYSTSTTPQPRHGYSRQGMATPEIKKISIPNTSE
ncbi:hypothetical protein [Algoriphagus aquimarinus]